MPLKFDKVVNSVNLANFVHFLNLVKFGCAITFVKCLNVVYVRIFAKAGKTEKANKAGKAGRAGKKIAKTYL